MAGTLVISLSGLKLQNVEQLVTARGIDKVLVVDTPSAFAGNGGIAATKASALKAEAPELELQIAFVSGEAAEVADSAVASAVKSFQTAGFEVAPAEQGLSALVSQTETMESLDGQAIVSSGGIPADASSPDFNVEQYLAPEALELNEEGESFSLDSFIFSETDELKEAISKPFVASVPSYSASSTLLSDLEGGVRVNMTTDEFRSLAAASKAGEADVQISVPSEPASSTVTVDGQPLPELVAAEGFEEDFNLPTTKWLGDTDMSTFSTDSNQRVSGQEIKDLAAAGVQLQDFGPSTQARAANYYFYEQKDTTQSMGTGEFTFTAQEWLSIPNEGITSYK